MKASELRIGNYFQSEIIQRVDLPHLEFLLNDKMDHSVMKPIPLTEEWLLKFGFDNTCAFTYVKGKFPVFLTKKFAYFHTAQFEYVHQLQNLFFAMTCEELEIKAQ